MSDSLIDIFCSGSFMLPGRSEIDQSEKKDQSKIFQAYKPLGLKSRESKTAKLNENLNIVEFK